MIVEFDWMRIDWDVGSADITVTPKHGSLSQTEGEFPL